MLFMSSFDFLWAFVNSVMGPAMVPKGIGVPGAVGNQLSCDVQGFLAYVSGAASEMLNVSLALCYLLMVRYEYDDERLHKLEPYFLYVPLSASLIMAVSGLTFGIYNFNGTFNVCFIDASPLNCDKSESPVVCERGEQYKYWFYYNSLLIFTESCVILFSMIKTYTAVLQRERSGDRFRFRIASRPDTRRNLSNTMRSQGLWYSGAFLFTFLLIMLFFVWTNYFTQIFSFLTLYLIGFTNAVIYVRPRFIKFRQDFPSLGVTSSIWYTLVRKQPAREDMTGRSATTELSPSFLRIALDRLSSGMQSLTVVMRSIMVSAGKRNSHPDALASIGKDEVITSCQEEGNYGNDEKCSAIIGSEKGNQQDEIAREEKGLENNDDTDVKTHQECTCMEENKDSEIVGSEDHNATPTMEH